MGMLVHRSPEQKAAIRKALGLPPLGTQAELDAIEEELARLNDRIDQLWIRRAILVARKRAGI